ncbi:MAG: PA2778 family cysteine peptidase [Stagnimonas sp.]|nr:PA2778 family cysteine peptidase [Stagnimonas sp.]
MIRIRTRLPALLLAAVLSGCAALPPAPGGSAVHLAGVPAYAQDELQCGPAALASALNAAGVAATPEGLKPDLYIPGRRGSLQIELLAQTRARARLPLILPPQESALIEALRDGQPPLLLLNLGVRSYPVWHYAVLVGYDPEQGYLLNDGKAEPSRYSRRALLRRWDWANRWAMSVHAPDQIPQHAVAERWIAAAAPFEKSAPAVAETAYRAAVQRWPERALVQAAWGAQRYGAGALPEALLALRKAVALEPANAAYANNLASLELARGCPQAGLAILDAINPTQVAPANAAALRATRAEIEASPAGHCPDSKAP